MDPCQKNNKRKSTTGSSHIKIGSINTKSVMSSQSQLRSFWKRKANPSTVNSPWNAFWEPYWLSTPTFLTGGPGNGLLITTLSSSPLSFTMLFQLYTPSLVQLTTQKEILYFFSNSDWWILIQRKQKTLCNDYRGMQEIVYFRNLG